MATRNDITGDKIQSKAASDAYRDNYDAIFNKHKEKHNSTMMEFADQCHSLDQHHEQD